MLGGRTRAALEREKTLVLRAIKDLEFDHAMGKVSRADFDEMGARLRARAARLLTQLDAGSGYKAAIELEVRRRLGPAPEAPQAQPVAASSSVPSQVAKTCGSCQTENDVDARFCKSCGYLLGKA
jgi:hypothetical protein